MANEKTGVWLDTETGKVVKSQPEQGRLLVAPGNEMTPDIEAFIAAYHDVEAPVVERPEVETAVAPQATEHATAAPVAKKAVARKVAAKKVAAKKAAK